MIIISIMMTVQCGCSRISNTHLYTVMCGCAESLVSVYVSGQGSTPEYLGAESGDEARDALVLCCEVEW